MVIMRDKFNSTKPGAVAMITVILMSIVLMVLVIGLVQLMVNEQRQSSDNELTNRAFYTAEAGLESARQYVSELSPGQVATLAGTSLADADCLTGSDNLQGELDPLLIGEDSYKAEVVCQKISGVGGTYTVGPEIGINSPRQYDLGNNKDSLLVQWAPKNDASENFRTNPSLPAHSAWDSPAVIRLQLFSFEPSASRDDLKAWNKEFYLLPGDGSSTHAFSTPPAPVLASCTTVGKSDGQKMCSVEITGIPNSGSATNLFVRISYLYDTTTTDLAPLPLGNLAGQLRVDTTGRVGDIFRRIQANIDVGNSAADNLPGYTLLGNQICKSFEVTNDTDDYAEINNSDLDYCAATN